MLVYSPTKFFYKMKSNIPQILCTRHNLNFGNMLAIIVSGKSLPFIQVKIIIVHQGFIAKVIFQNVFKLPLKFARSLLLLSEFIHQLDNFSQCETLSFKLINTPRYGEKLILIIDMFLFY